MLAGRADWRGNYGPVSTPARRNIAAWSSISMGSGCSQRLVNDEAQLVELISEVQQLADGGVVMWAIDLNVVGERW
jgi:hypothetical protein